MNSSNVDLDRLTLEAAGALIESRVLSPVDLTSALLERIVALEPHLHAFVDVFSVGARDAAKVAESEIASGHYRGPLHGIPMVLKDLFDLRMSPTTASSLVRSDYFPLADAHVVALLKTSGAIVVGKSHTHEFAYGGVTPQTHNPWDVTRIAGGSSGGSAVAVASGEALFALGTDTAGSIRIPSSCCGVVGLKPTYGRVSRHGVTPLSPSLDHVGPIVRGVRDAAHVLHVIAGFDEKDPTSASTPVPDYLARIEDGIVGLRLGVPENFFFEHCADVVVAGVVGLARRLEALGAVLVPFRVPYSQHYSDVEFCIAMAEATSFHAPMLKERGALYGEETRVRLEAGQSILATEYLDALKQKRDLTASWLDATRDLDIVVTPTLPHAAPRPSDELVTWPGGFTEMLDASLTRLNCPHNLTGQPAISLRCGFDGPLPFGVQFIAKSFDECTLLRTARAAERVLGPWSEGPFPTTAYP